MSEERFPCRRVVIGQDLGFEQYTDGRIYLVRDRGSSYERLAEVTLSDPQFIIDSFDGSSSYVKSIS